MADPTEATEALRRFAREESTLLGLVHFVGHLITRADEGRRIAAKALLASDRTDEERAEHEAALKEGDVVRRTMQDHFAQLLTRMMLAHGVDNFLTYVVDLIALIFKTRPEALRSSETVKLEDVLRHSTMEELVSFLVERKVDRLAYQGMRELSSDLDRTLGFPLFEDEESLTEAIRVVETRNLIVHNRGIVNKKFLRQVADSGYEEGDDLFVSGDAALADLRRLREAVIDMDQRAIAKFGLPTHADTGPQNPLQTKTSQPSAPAGSRPDDL